MFLLYRILDSCQPKSLVDPVGLEPTTNGLKVRCSTTELRVYTLSPPRERLCVFELYRVVVPVLLFNVCQRTLGSFVALVSHPQDGLVSLAYRNHVTHLVLHALRYDRIIAALEPLSTSFMRAESPAARDSPWWAQGRQCGLRTPAGSSRTG